MIFSFTRELELRSDDFILFPDTYRREIQCQLPLKHDIAIGCHSIESGNPVPISGSVNADEKVLLAAAESGKPVCAHALLIIPFVTRDEKTVCVTIRGVDPGLLEKMSPEWLDVLQENLYERFRFVRQVFVDPITGRYNGRCLAYVLNCRPADDQSRNLLIISTSSRTSGVSSGFQKISLTASFLQAVTAEPVFYLGNHVFALVIPGQSRKKILGFAARLLARMKRDGYFRVHIGCLAAGSASPKSVEYLLDRCWVALERSEARGPFSKYFIDEEDNEGQDPFSMPSTAVMHQLHRLWRKTDSFSLVFMQADSSEGIHRFQEHVPSLLGEGEEIVPCSEKEAYLFLPIADSKEAEQRAMAIHNRLRQVTGVGPVSFGVVFWPCPDYTKKDLVTNCKKAIMHGRFFGQAQCTVFDAVTLNVSGDYYFDEGDYKQAAKDYQKGLVRAGDDINLMNSLGVTMIEMNRYRQAMIWFQKVLALDPQNSMALINMGFTLRSLGNETEALSCFEKAYAIAGSSGEKVSSDLYMQLARLYCQERRYEEGLNILERWEKEGTGKQEFILYRLLGEAYLETGRNAQAIIALQRALRLYPEHPESLSMLGLLYFETGQGDEIGMSLCRKAVELDGNNAGNHYRLALLHFRRHEEIALAEVRLSLALKRKENFSARLLLAAIYSYNKKYYPARKIYERILMTGLNERQRAEALAGLETITKIQAGRE